ncbi:MAG: ATP-binding protein [bacterium]|nr:ATP-binding protein [bacterium]
MRIPAEPCCLRLMRATVESFCAAAGMDEKAGCRVVLAVDEACTNIIRHSYEGPCEKPIVCEGRIENGDIVIVLRDFGKKVDPARIQPRDLSDVRPGGLGVHFIREVMDDVTFEDCGEEGTRLHMKKHLSAKGDSA